MNPRLMPKYMQNCYRVEYLPGDDRGRWCVIDPNGQRVGAPTTEDAAIARAERLQTEVDTRAKRGPRPCLCCGATFDSEGIHNRLCNPCRGRADPMPSTGYSGSSDGRKPRRSAGA